MSDKIRELQLRVKALELVLISNGIINKEKLETFQKEAQQEFSRISDEFRQGQWSKIKIGSIIEYELGPATTLTLEIISISPESFCYIAGKILKKSGRSGYRLGEIFTVCSPYRIRINTGLGYGEIISRE